jgi:uncharacterized protein (TIGR03382 family)
MKTFRVLTAALAAALAGSASADNWLVNITCDNQFDLYFGNPLATTSHEGYGNNWGTTYTFNATGRLPTDYVYVATSSDQSVAQGLIGDFTNLTQARSSITGDNQWEVFPAGAYAQALGITNPWPAGLQPTQAQVDAAIAYATLNNLWVPPDTSPSGAPNGVGPWGFRPGIAATAQWIWHRAPGGPADPLSGGYNHDEFLVFRLVGELPAPGSAAVMGMGLLAVGRRRRA